MTARRISGKHFIWAVASRGDLSDQCSQTGCPGNGCSAYFQMTDGAFLPPGQARTSPGLRLGQVPPGQEQAWEWNGVPMQRGRPRLWALRKKGLLKATGLAQTSPHPPLSPIPHLRSLHTGNSGWAFKQHRADSAQTLPHILPLKVKGVLRRFTCLSPCYSLHVTLGECSVHVNTHFLKTSASHGLCLPGKEDPWGWFICGLDFSKAINNMLLGILQNQWYLLELAVWWKWQKKSYRSHLVVCSDHSAQWFSCPCPVACRLGEEIPQSFAGCKFRVCSWHGMWGIVAGPSQVWQVCVPDGMPFTRPPWVLSFCFCHKVTGNPQVWRPKKSFKQCGN